MEEVETGILADTEILSIREEVLSEEIEEESDIITGVCGDNLTWTLSEGVLTISGTGAMYDYTEEENPWRNMTGITGLKLEYGITHIGNWAFYPLSGSQGELVIPGSVTSIGEYAFCGCGFTGELVIPESVREIGNSAFEGCRGFTGDLIIPEGIIRIGDFAFRDCMGFDGELVLSANGMSIGEWAFSWCSGFTGTLEIPDGVTEIGEYAFWGCSGFDGELHLPKSIRSIEDGAFGKCTGFIGDLYIPEKVTQIGASAFWDCAYLSGTAYIPPSVISIDQSGFNTIYIIFGVPGSYAETYANKQGLEFQEYFEYDEIDGGTCGDNLAWTLEDGVLTISGTGAMYDYVEYEAPWYNYCGDVENPVTLNIESGITSIGAYAFYEGYGIRGELSIPASVTDIGECAFFDCCSLEGNLIIPAAVENIGEKVFYACNGLNKKAYVPATVKSIGLDALYNQYIIYGEKGSYAETYALEDGLRFIEADSGADIEDSIIDAGKCGDKLVWTVNEEGVLEITGSGDMYNYAEGEAPWYEYEGIRSLQLGHGITRIGRYAFSGCTQLTGDLVIPTSVNWIRQYAFSGCSGLSGNAYIPVSVITIGAGALNTITTIYGEEDSYVKDWARINGAKFIVHDFEMKVIISGQCGENLTYTLNTDWVLEISGIGDMYDYSAGSAPWYVYRNHIKELKLADGITKIGNYAFSEFSRITGDLVFSENVSSIGHGAFYRCKGLSGVAYIPANVSSIGKGALEIDIIYGEPASYAETYASENEIDFIDYNFEEGVIGTGKCGENLRWALYPGGTFVLSGTGEMYDYMEETVPWYKYRERIVTLQMENGVSKIGDYAFIGCKELKGELDIPESVISIGRKAFYNCNGLTGNLMIPTGMVSIGAEAFSGCSNLLGRAFVPDTVTSIGMDVFSTIHTIHGVIGSCAESYARENKLEFVEYDYEKVVVGSGKCGDNLTWVLGLDWVLTISGTGEMYDYKSYDGPPWYEYREEKISLVLEDGIARIGEYAFSECRGFIGELIIPETVESIGSSAFNMCSGFIGDLIIPIGVTSIGDEAFKDCSGMSGVAYIPRSVLSIGEESLNTINKIYGLVGSYAESYASDKNIMFEAYDDVVLATGSCGENLTWTLSGNGVLTISGTGEMDDYSRGEAPWFEAIETALIQDTISLKFKEGVTSIGD